VTRRQFLAGSATAATAAVVSGLPVRAAAASTNPADLSVLQALAAMKARTLAPSELLQACLARIDALDPTLMAFLQRTDEVATAAAKASDARYAAGTALLLDGLPYAAKDIFYTQGIPTTCASAAWGSYLADEDATLVTRLAAAGACLTGKVNTHEFAFGASTPPTRNPWDTSLIPGGSSGGSGSIVGAHALPMATGSDTIGSLRIPASVNGIVGIRPTFGLTSRHGVVPLAFSFDTTGLLSRTVADAAFLLSFVVGPDPGDPTTVTAVTTTYPTSAPADLKGVRLGMPTSWFFDGASAAISSSVHAAVAHAQARGAVVVDVDLPAVFTEVMAPQPGADTLVGTDGLSAVLGDALSVPTIVCYAEAAGYHYRLRREAMAGYSQDIKRAAHHHRTDSGLVLPASTAAACRVRRGHARHVHQPRHRRLGRPHLPEHAARAAGQRRREPVGAAQRVGQRPQQHALVLLRFPVDEHAGGPGRRRSPGRPAAQRAATHRGHAAVDRPRHRGGGRLRAAPARRPGRALMADPF